MRNFIKIHHERKLTKDLRLAKLVMFGRLLFVNFGKFRILYFHEFVTHTCKLCMHTKLGMMLNRPASVYFAAMKKSEKRDLFGVIN